jgi:transcriptional regulator with XRE-family HTH domain
MYGYGRPKVRYMREVLMRVKDPETIRDARVAAGYTQRNLAALARCSQATISAIERGEMRGCSKDLANELCKWLKRTERELFISEPGSRVGRVTNASGSKRHREAVAA